MIKNSNSLVQIERATLKKLHKRSLGRWLCLVACDWGMIIAAFVVAAYAHHWGVYWLASLVIGNRIHALGVMAHDGAHYAVSRNRFINDFLTVMFSFWPLGISLTGYRDFHFQHHQQVGTDLDPELIHKNWAKPGYDLPLSKPKFIWRCLRDLTGYSVGELLCVIFITMPRRTIDILPALLVQACFIGTCVYTQAYWIPCLWYFSYITSFWLSMRLRIWIEHVGTDSIHRVQLKWWQEILFAPHWISYHHEHHLFPSVPMWNLPILRQEDRSKPVLTLKSHIDNLTTLSQNLSRV